MSPLAPATAATILAKLEEMDGRREQHSVDLRDRLERIESEVKRTNGRVTALEQSEVREEGERAGKASVVRIAATTAAIAAAVTGVLFQVIDHLKT